MNALLFQYEICNVSRGLSETANCAHELFRGHSHCDKNYRLLNILRNGDVYLRNGDVNKVGRPSSAVAELLYITSMACTVVFL